ncbi:ricin-type beta-trefoil lectin domain protein [Streptomyces sp. NPDC049687]|uniref:ricin-type beta-trefoil lectin domain protein n=1 Tax=Streptomyces sp. NPDC049687 TaxID=3365596 RepID=UPI0037A910DC
MHSPNPPRPPYPPRPGWSPGDSDPHLAARLAEGDGSGRAVALLLARHWRSAHDYAAVCLADTGDSARLVTAAAFRTVFGRLAEGHFGGALRPQLLVAVRNTVREWAGTDGLSDFLPELRKTVGGRGLRAAGPVTAERRQLAGRAFQLLPAASQCLLWHTEVEAEPLSVSAGLLGVDDITAAAGLEQAREQFRAGCVRAHRELAPSAECRFYNRLLDVPLRRGGTLLPDVRQHLAQCRFCRHAAEQLSHFDGGLDALLAETVLGWGAHRYLASRPGRPESPYRPAPTTPGRPTGRHRTTASGLLALPGRRPKAVLVGVGLTSVALVATVLVARSWSDDQGVPAPRVTWGAPVGGTGTPGADGAGTPRDDDPTRSGSPSATSATRTGEVAHGRLRGVGTGRCLDVAGGRAESGAAAVPAACSPAASQRSSYWDDGLLRGTADPTLCLAVGPGGTSAAPAGCVVHSGEAFLDLTVGGELPLRSSGDPAVAPGTGQALAKVVVTGRDGSEGQRWLFGTTHGTKANRTTEGQVPAKPSAPRTAPPLSRDSGSAPTGSAPAAPRLAPPASESERGIAQAGCCGAPEPTGPSKNTEVLGSPPAATDAVKGGVAGGSGARSLNSAKAREPGQGPPG